jgi:hypothetical protein
VGSPWAERWRGGLAVVESEARRLRSVCEMLGERRVRGVVWRGGGGLAYIGSGGGGETAGKARDGWWRCGLTAVT